MNMLMEWPVVYNMFMKVVINFPMIFLIIGYRTVQSPVVVFCNLFIIRDCNYDVTSVTAVADSSSSSSR